MPLDFQSDRYPTSSYATAQIARDQGLGDKAHLFAALRFPRPSRLKRAARLVERVIWALLSPICRMRPLGWAITGIALALGLHIAFAAPGKIARTQALYHQIEALK